MANEITANQFLLIEQKLKDAENQLSDIFNRVQTLENSNEHVAQ